MLSVVSTPIGNLEDISIRVARTLIEADVILAEDTRSVRNLIDKISEVFGLLPPFSQQIWSYYKEVEFEKLSDIIQLLKEEKNICLISEAGTPVISDPGFLLIHHVIKRELPYTVIPGPSAVTTSLLHSGFNPEQFMFEGFLPKRESALKKTFETWKKVKELYPKMVISFFESPHRINETLTVLEGYFPEAKIAICRELTKMHEEIHRGTAAELKDKQYKGELTVVMQ